MWETYIDGKDIYLGLSLIKSLTSEVAKAIITEREANGLFEDIDNFIDRIHISLEQASILIKINAFRFTKKNKRELLWEAHMKIRKVALEEHIITLFRSEKRTYKIPSLEHIALEDAFDISLETDDIVDFSSFTKGMEILKKYKVNL